MGVRGKPRMYLILAGFLYRPLWTFQLWPPDASAHTDASRTLAAEFGTLWAGNEDRQFSLKCRLSRYILGIFHTPQICDMGTTTLLPFRRKAWLRIFPPLKIRRLRPGLKPRTWVTEASTLTLRPPKPLSSVSYGFPFFRKYRNVAFGLVLCVCKLYEHYSVRHLPLTTPLTEWSSVVSIPVLDTETTATNEKQSD
jgi:hypothetical protein